MSQQQYTAIQKMRLIDLKTLSENTLNKWLNTKPHWMQKALTVRINSQR